MQQAFPTVSRLLGSEKFLRSLFLWGPTGVGKSSLVRQAVLKLADRNPFQKPKPDRITRGCEVYGDWGLVDLRVSTLDTSDLRGCPFPDGGLTQWLPPEELPLVGQEKHFPAKGILFLDELNLAEPAVQSSGYSLVLDRKTGTHQLLPGWKVVAAGNLRSEQAYTFELGHPLKNRFLHYLLQPDLDAFKAWGYQVGISEDIIAFLNFRSDYLHKDDSESSYAFPTPRSWEYVHEVLSLFSNGDRLHNIAACVGIGVAHEFHAFLQVRDTEQLAALKNVPAILRGKLRVKLSADDFQTAWAFSAGLMSFLRSNPDQLPALMHYLCSKDWEEVREVSRMMLKDIRVWDEQATYNALLDAQLLDRLTSTYQDYNVGRAS